jgi:hypothetical protein
MNKQIIDAKWAPEMDLDSIFQELGDQCKIAIERKEPEWCSGHMRTIHFNPDEPISIDWIQKKVGGDKLMIRLYGPKTPENKSGYLAARTIDIFGKPLDGYGVELVQGPDGKAYKVTELPAVLERHKQKMGVMYQAEQRPPAPPAAPSPLQNDTLVQTLITTQGEQNRIMMQMMSDRVRSLEEMLYKKPESAGGPATSPVDQVKQTIETLGLLETMRQTIGAGAGAGAGGEESVIPMVGDIVKALITGRQQTAEQPPRGVLGPPGRKKGRPGPRREAPRRDLDESQVPALRPVDDKYLSDIADNLAGLSPDDAAECVYLAMDNMTEDQRAAAMKSFLVNMSGQTELDGPLIDDDTYSQDDAESYEDPFAVSKDSKVSIQREQPNTNAQNDSADRAGDPNGVASPTDPELRGGARDTGTE